MKRIGFRGRPVLTLQQMVLFIMVGLVIEVGLALVAVEPELAIYELSAAEHLAGNWKIGSIRQAATSVGDLGDKCALVVKESVSDFQDRGAARESCFERAFHDDRPFVVNPRIDVVSASEILGWWPHQVLGWGEDGGFSRCMFAASEAGGMRGGTNRAAGIITVAFAQETSPILYPIQRVLDGGGWVLTQEGVSGSGRHPSGRDGIGTRIRVEGGEEARGLIERVVIGPERVAELPSSVSRAFFSWYDEAREQRFELVISPNQGGIEQGRMVLDGLVALEGEEANEEVCVRLDGMDAGVDQ